MPASVVPTAGYAPALGVLNVLNKVRRGTVSGPLDQNLLRSMGIAESLTKRTVHTYKALGLIDDEGNFTDAFVALIGARPDEYQAHLAEFLNDAYAPVFAILDPATASPAELANAFWIYEPRGQHESMIRLFLALCEEAGIVTVKPKVESAPRKASAGNGTATRRTSTSTTGNGKHADPTSDPIPPTPPARNAPGVTDSVELRSGGMVTLTVDVNLFQLSSEDREFVLGLVDKVKGYRERRQLMPGPAAPEEVPTS
jgi:hypothetical protein